MAFQADTPFTNRSMPPAVIIPNNYHSYTVVQAFPAYVGTRIPWIGQAGGGVGFVLVDGTWEVSDHTSQPTSNDCVLPFITPIAV